MEKTTPNIQINIEDFRAINKANLIIDGITVVAGENGSGKSSISKLLYFLYKTVSNYEILVKKRLSSDLGNVGRFFDIFQQELRLNIKERKSREDFRREVYELRKGLINSEDLKDELTKWLNIVQILEEVYDQSNAEPSERFRHNAVRFNYIIKDILRFELKKGLKNDDFEFDMNKSFSEIKAFIENNFNQAIKKIKTRPTSLFKEELKSVFSNGNLPEKFEVLEFNDLIVSLKKKDLSIPYTIQNSIYIDTPMMISVDDSHNIHWDDLNDLLLDKRDNKNNQFTKLISSEIIQGDVVLEDGTYPSDDFIFKRNDGATFNLNDVATGIKSFSILQMLLKKGLLTDKTLLIIDEPESNLHPQWIIEYARIIVMLNKKLGVKFFLATHNPDMVSAIRYISEKEKILERVNFYLAEKSDEKFKYDYKFLDKEIDPIFESFNIAIERINKYGI
jgi:energy-coupling factor transporter ATP-binding protein EcfA2